MFSIITTAASNEVIAAVSAGIGNRRINPQFYLSRDEPGAIIVSVPDWAGTLLTAALRRMGAWFDRAMPAGRIPTGRPIISHAGASQVRNQRFDRVDRRDRKVRRDMKGAA